MFSAKGMLPDSVISRAIGEGYRYVAMNKDTHHCIFFRVNSLKNGKLIIGREQNAIIILEENDDDFIVLDLEKADTLGV